MLKDRRTYEIMLPEDIGLSESKIVLGKHSGRHALQKRLEELGYRMGQVQLDKVFERFKVLADKKKNIYDEDLTALVADDVFDVPLRYEIVSIDVKSGTHTKPWARVCVRIDGKEHSHEAHGNGPVNAVVQALKECTGNDGVTLEDYRIDALSGGSDAQGRVSLTVTGDGLMSRGRATHLDVVMASAMAFVTALNHRAFQIEISKRQAEAASA
jgi:2-isopropylmalate synthase